MMRKIQNYLKNIIVSSILLLFVILSLIGIQSNNHAMATPIASLAVIMSSPAAQTGTDTAEQTPIDTSTPTATTTSTPTATPTSTPISTPPPTPTPTPTPTPKPTQVPPPPTPTKAPITQPTTTPTLQPTVNVGNGIATPPAIVPTVPSIIPSTTPTSPSTPVPTPNAVMPTATPALNTGVATGGNNDQSGNNNDNSTPPSATNNNNQTIAMGTIAIGTALLILLAGTFGFVRLRKRNTQSFTLQPSALAQTTPWQPSPNIGSNAMPRQMVQETPMPYAPETPIPPFPNLTQPTQSTQAYTNTFQPEKSLLDGAPFSHLPLGETQQTQVSADAAATARYRPSDLRPITTAIPRQNINPKHNPISTSDMSPLSLDSFDFAAHLPANSQNSQNSQQDTLLSPAHNENNNPASDPVLAPNIQDDPMLETIMRQAQMGLYTLPDKERKDTVDSGPLD
jgi:outer membrane biosynthesis protein TonB